MSTLENKTLFLGDLSRFCTEIELEELFSQYGQVLEIKISRTSTGISLGYGFISMSERSQAEEAMVKLRGSVLSGRPIRIDWAARNVRDNNSYASTNEMINSIHVRYHTLQRMDSLFTEENLTLFFESYGKVVDISIKNSSMDQHNGIQRGYGFVHFEKNAEGMKAAVMAVTNETGDSTVSLECEVSKNLLKHSPFLNLPGNNREGIAAASNLIQNQNGGQSISRSNSLENSGNEIFRQVPIDHHDQGQDQGQAQQYYDGQGMYYTNQPVSGDSASKVCYPSILHSLHMTPCMAPVHPIHMQDPESYALPINGDESYHQAAHQNSGKWFYVYNTEGEEPSPQMTAIPQQVYYQCGDAYTWGYQTNTSISSGITDGENSESGSPHNGAEQYPYNYGMIPGAPVPNDENDASRSQVLLPPQEYTSYISSPLITQQVNIDPSRTYPPYVGYAHAQLMQQNPHYIYQPTLSGVSPQINGNGYFPSGIPTLGYRYSPKGAAINGIQTTMSQTMHSPLGNYQQQQMYSHQPPCTFQGSRSMPMSHGPTHLSYNTMIDVQECSPAIHKQPFMRKASLTLHKIKAFA